MFSRKKRPTEDESNLGDEFLDPLFQAPEVDDEESGSRRPPGTAPLKGRRGNFTGRASHIDPGSVFLASGHAFNGLYPFGVSSGSPLVGAPLGKDLFSGETVCYDPFEYLKAGFVTNPTVFVLAQAGVGKSALLKHIMICTVALGNSVIVLGDVKPDYPPVIRALGGQILEIGRGSRTLNPLDTGALQHAAELLRRAGKEEAAHGLEVESISRRAALIANLLGIIRASNRIPDDESVVINELLTTKRVQSIHHAIELLRRDDEWDPELRRAATSVRHALGLLTSGQLSGVFDDQSTFQLDLNAPAIELDISSLTRGGDDVAIGAAMVAVWSQSLSVIDATRELALHGLTNARNFVTIFDELWMALRASDLTVDMLDNLARTNRSRGMTQIMVTHSVNDLQLQTPQATAKAHGILERCGTKFFGAMPLTEAHRIQTLAGLSDAQCSLLASWAHNSGWDRSGGHPGRGRVFLSTGQGGIAVQVNLTPAELELIQTDSFAATGAERHSVVDLADDPVEGSNEPSEWADSADLSGNEGVMI